MLGGKRRRLKQWPLDSYLSPLSGPAQGQGGGKWAGNHVPPGLRQERGQPCKAPGRSEAGETGIEYGTSRSVPTLTPGHGPNVRNVPKALGGRWLLSLVRKSRWGLSLLSKLSSRACPIHLNSSGDSVSETPPGDAGHSAACRGHPNGSTPGTLPGPHEDTRCRGGHCPARCPHGRKELLLLYAMSGCLGLLDGPLPSSLYRGAWPWPPMSAL